MKYIALFIMLFTSAFAINGRYDYTDTTPLNAINGSNTVYVGPGNADDDVAIQAALDKLATTGGRVICQAGAYNLSAPIKVPSNVTLEFLRPNTVKIPATNTIDSDTVLVNNKASSGTLFRSGNAGTTTWYDNIHIIGANIDFESGPDAAKFEEDKHYIGILLENCTNSSIEDCSINNVVYDSFDGSGWHGVGGMLANCTGSKIKNSYASYCGYEGFDIRGGSQNCTIEDCVAEYNRNHSMQISCWGDTAANKGAEYTQNPIQCAMIRCRDTSSVSNWSYTSSAPVNQLMVHGAPGKSRNSSGISFIDCEADSIAAIYTIKDITISGCNTGCIMVDPEIEAAGGNNNTIENLTITGNIMPKGSQYKYAKLRFGPLVSGAADGMTATLKNVNISNNTFILTSTLAFNSGGTYVIKTGDTITGATSGSTAKVISVHTTSGTFAGGDAAGTICLSGQSAGFTAAGENINVGANSNVATLYDPDAGGALTANSSMQMGVYITAQAALNKFVVDDVLVANNLFIVDGFNSTNTCHAGRIESGASVIDGVTFVNNKIIPGSDTSHRPFYLYLLGAGNITNTRIIGNESVNSAGMEFITLYTTSTGVINGLRVEDNYWNRAATYSFIRNVAGNQLNIYTSGNETAGNAAFYTITAGSVTQAPGSGANIIHLGTDADDAYTVTTADNGATFTNLGDTTDALTFTLPAATVGLKYCFEDRVNSAAVDLYIDPDGTEVFTLNGTDMGAGEQYRCESDAYGSLMVECLVAGKWTIKNVIGTWVEQTP